MLSKHLTRSILTASTNTSIRPRWFASRVTPFLSEPAPEYQQDSHQLRLSASPKGPANPGSITVAQETLCFRRTGFSPVLSCTYACILTSISSSNPSRLPSANIERFPTTTACAAIRDFGILLSPVHFWRINARPVSYYALFKGWLLLSQPPGCLCTYTSFTT